MAFLGICFQNSNDGRNAEEFARSHKLFPFQMVVNQDVVMKCINLSLILF